MSENTPVEFPEVEFPPTPVNSGNPQSTADGDPSKDWMAIVSLVTGVLSLCSAVATFFLPIMCCLGLIFTISAVVLGILGLKSTKKTLAIIGIVVGGVGLITQIIGTFVGLISGLATGNFMQELENQLESLDSFNY